MKIVDFRQRVSEKTKYAKDKQWAKNIVDQIIPRANLFGDNYYNRIRRYKSNYKFYNNELDQSDFEEHFNPMGIDVGQKPKEVKPYNRATPKLNELFGEELKRPDEAVPYLISSHAMYEKDKEFKALWKQSIDQIIAKVQNSPNFEQLDEREKEEFIGKLVDEITPRELEFSKFKSAKEKLAYKISDYYYAKQDIKRKKNQAFRDGAITSDEIVYLGYDPRSGPYVENVNPIGFFYSKGANQMFYQQGEYAGQAYSMTLGEVLDTFGRYLTKSDIDQLFSQYSTGTPEITGGINYYLESTVTNRLLRSQAFDNHDQGYVNDESQILSLRRRVLVEHVTWRSQREVGFLSIFNGEEEIVEIVDSDFTIPEDATKVKYIDEYGEEDSRWEWVEGEIIYHMTYEWVPRIWEGTRIAGDIYIKMQEIPGQEGLHVDLPYYGINWSNYNAEALSLIDMMKPFAMLFMIVMNQVVDLISRNNGVVANIDTAQIPSELGRDGRDPTEMLLWYRRQGLGFFNSAEHAEGPNAHTRGAPVHMTNESNVADIINLLHICDWLDIQIGKSIGFTPEREGLFSSNSNVTDNLQAIQRSANVTEIFYFKHNQLWSKVKMGYINLFISWARDWFRRNPNKKEMILNYILDGGDRAVLKLTPDILEEAEVGMFLKGSGQQEIYFNKLEGFLLPLIQNGMEGATDISEILKARSEGASPQEIHDKIQIMEAARQDRAAQIQQEQLRIQEENNRRIIENREDEQAARLEQIIVQEREKRDTQLQVEEKKLEKERELALNKELKTN